MYTPINLLADYVAINQRRLHFRDRWKTDSGKLLSAKLLTAIAKGQLSTVKRLTTPKPSGFFEGSYDLRGLRYIQMTLAITDPEFFRNAVLNYSRFRDTKIKRTAFVSIAGNFIDASRTRFDEVTFVRTSFFGANFEDCVFENCNFLDRNAFSNCSFKNVFFVGCYFATDIFTDCSFDERTNILTTAKAAHRFSYWKEPLTHFDKRYLSSHYSGIREAYEAGHVSTLARKYLFREKQAFTRYNAAKGEKLTRYFLEYTNGYGIKPLRVLTAALVIFSLFGAVFISKFGESGFLMSAGGFFTFGADTGLLDSAGVLYHILYVLEAFLGIANMSIFIVVMTNYWSSLR